MAFLFQDQNQGIRNDVSPHANARRLPQTVLFHPDCNRRLRNTPNLLTLLLGREEGARGLGLRHPYRRWGFSPRPENIGRPEWTTCVENMTNAGASASTFGMGNRHVPIPREQGAPAGPADGLTPAAAIGIACCQQGDARHETS